MGEFEQKVAKKRDEFLGNGTSLTPKPNPNPVFLYFLCGLLFSVFGFSVLGVVGIVGDDGGDGVVTQRNHAASPGPVASLCVLRVQLGSDRSGLRVRW